MFWLKHIQFQFCLDQWPQCKAFIYPKTSSFKSYHIKWWNPICVAECNNTHNFFIIFSFSLKTKTMSCFLTSSSIERYLEENFLKSVMRQLREINSRWKMNFDFCHSNILEVRRKIITSRRVFFSDPVQEILLIYFNQMEFQSGNWFSKIFDPETITITIAASENLRRI